MLLEENGFVVWITGLSGAGKTTIARVLQKRFQESGLLPVLLDGDAMRQAMQDPNYGYDRDSRLRGAYRYSRFAKLIADQGVPVIVATISLFHEIHLWNRQHLKNYYEIFVEADEATRRERDPKRLYRDHDEGRNTNMTGVDVIAEIPKNPHLILKNNTNDIPVNTQVEIILKKIEVLKVSELNGRSS